MRNSCVEGREVNCVNAIAGGEGPRFRKCELCNENLSKYKCPRCFVETCSVQCVRQHKLDSNCSGVRDQAAFVDMKKFNDRHLLNDYRFLEETSRKVDSTTRDVLKRRRDKPNFLKELHRQAKKRKIDLRLMPYPMEKRKNNFTTFHNRSQTILWQIEWVFPKCDTRYISKRISEQSKLNDLLKSYIDSTEGDPVCRQKLKQYNQKGLDMCRVFVKVESRPANSVRYYELDKELSVVNNLAGKRIVEYPTMYVDFGECLEYVLLETEVKDCFGSKSLDTLSAGEIQPSTGTKSLSPEVKSSISNSKHDLSNYSEKSGIVHQTKDVLQNIGSDSQSDVLSFCDINKGF